MSCRSLVTAVLSPLAFVAAATQATAQSVPPLERVFVVVFENTDYQPTIDQPFFRRFAAEGALFTSFYAETHPSQPNYIAMTAGALFGVSGNDNYDLDAEHIGDRLEAAGKTWRVYAEDYPGHCFLGAQAGRYVRKHTPFVSFKNVTSNPARCANIVPATQLAADMAGGHLPDYAYYVPNLDNDGHDTGVAFADRWFERTFGPLLHDDRFIKGLTLVATFDESSGSGGNHIYTALYGAHVKPGTRSAVRYDHYSLLRTIEEGLALTGLGQNDESATAITDVWQ